MGQIIPVWNRDVSIRKNYMLNIKYVETYMNGIGLAVFKVMVRMTDCYASDLGSIPGLVVNFWRISLLSSSNWVRIIKKKLDHLKANFPFHSEKTMREIPDLCKNKKNCRCTTVVMTIVPGCGP